MGNCFRHGKSSWNVDDDDDDWGSLVSSTHRHKHGDHDGEINSMEKEKLLGGTREVVKITISKRELEQLVQKVDMQGLTLEQVLATMVLKAGGEDHVFEIDYHHQHRPWKPVLQSIPEVN